MIRIRALVKQTPSLVTQRDPQGNTPLHYASLWDHPDIAKFLLERQADVNARNGRGKTPLHWAATCGSMEMVKLLLLKGANVSTRDHAGLTPLHAVVAIGREHLPNDTITELLLAGGADINAKDNEGYTALQWAIVLDHPVSARVLLRHAAEFDIFSAAALGDISRVAQWLQAEPALATFANTTGQTPLHWAAAYGRTQVVELLLASGANVNSISQEKCSTPLHGAAASSGTTDTVALLLANGADVHARTREGKTALEYAELNQRAEVAALLQTYDARP